MVWYALCAAVVYTIYGAMSYMSDFKTSVWYIPIGLLLSIIGNTLWLLYVKGENDTNTIFANGAIWDTMISVCFIVSIVFTGKSLSLQPHVLVGGLIALVGLIVMKVG